MGHTKRTHTRLNNSSELPTPSLCCCVVTGRSRGTEPGTHSKGSLNCRLWDTYEHNNASKHDIHSARTHLVSPPHTPVRDAAASPCLSLRFEPRGALAGRNGNDGYVLPRSANALQAGFFSQQGLRGVLVSFAGRLSFSYVFTGKVKVFVE